MYMYINLLCFVRCASDEREEAQRIIHFGDGDDGTHGARPHGVGEPRALQLHQRHAHGPRQTHVQGNVNFYIIHVYTRS